MKTDCRSTDSDSGPTLFPRRQFLVLGSAAVAAVAASSLSADLVHGALVLEDKAPRFSLGYAAATVDDFNKPSFAARLTSAAKLRSGDPSLADGVRLKVHGLVRPEAQRNTDVSMGLDAMYRVSGPIPEVPYMAWSYAQKRQHTTSSAPKDFVVPMSARHPLSLGVSTSAVRTAIDNAGLRGTVTLSLGDARRANKLRAGLYFIAICPAGSDAPDWASIRAVAPENGSAPLLKRATLTGDAPVPFDYVVVAAGRV
jgi:hypothetical protein